MWYCFWRETMKNLSRICEVSDGTYYYIISIHYCIFLCMISHSCDYQVKSLDKNKNIYRTLASTNVKATAEVFLLWGNHLPEILTHRFQIYLIHNLLYYVTSKTSWHFYHIRIGKPEFVILVHSHPHLAPE